MKKVVLVSGLMLFSFFFGAGNLIFPPMLGYTAQSSMWIAMVGFAITGILLPYLTVIVVAYLNGGVEQVGRRISPLFGVIFAVLIYMSIGAFYGIPRAANVAYEIGTRNILPVHNTWTLIAFSLVFFLIVYIIALYPNRIIDNIGKYLTPALLIIILLLCVFVIFNPQGHIGAPTGKYEQAPIISGILEGYFTLDLIAALAFSVVVVQAMKMAGINDRRTLVKNVIKAGAISALLLGLIYFALAYVGATTSKSGFKDGTDILTFNSLRVFGTFGDILFSAIVVLACLTTCIGLVNACAAFAMSKYNKISYKIYVLIFAVLGFLISTLGLELILQIAVPLLTFIYPVSIVLVLTSFADIFIRHELKYGFILPTIVALIVSVLQIFSDFKLIHAIGVLYQKLPLSDVQLAWLIPAIVLFIIGVIIDRVRLRKHA